MNHRKTLKHAMEKLGKPPGSFGPDLDTETESAPRPAPRLALTRYDADRLERLEPATIGECAAAIDPGMVNWIIVTGIPDPATLEAVGQRFGIHALVLEDLGNTAQRTKIEDHDSHIFIVIRSLETDPASARLAVGQISLVFGDHWLISVGEQNGNLLHHVHDRLEHSRGRIRKLGADYLAYAVIDLLVDHYFTALHHIDDRLEKLTEHAIADPRPEMVPVIQGVKHDLLLARKAAWPVREVVSELQFGDSPLITANVTPFLRDLADHANQIMDLIEIYRELAGAAMETYLSSLSNRMNTIMQVLTVIATIFIPVTFIAGIYGMNFEWMPELKWRWGYPAVMTVMALLIAVMLWFFRRRKWF
ncbi:MAG: magnesium/cobalt transporter CorA [Deltaproteobacteria bacterium]|nr:magnesium/cobalt transporter CorA [Candidatus Anaeroferrophillacea bacterium]